MSDTQLLLVGEVWGEDEQELSARFSRPCPFVGASGLMLYSRLQQAGIIQNPSPIGRYVSPRDMEARWQAEAPRILRTNVFQLRPGQDSNDLSLLLGKKSEHPTTSLVLSRKPLAPGQYLLSTFAPELLRLQTEIDQLCPNLVLALGATALWFFTDSRAISSARGTIHMLRRSDGTFQKVLPTFHPAAIFHKWELLAKVQMDCQKAFVHTQSQEFPRKSRTIHYQPESPDELWTWWEEHGRHSTLLSIDIETERMEQVSEVGIASSESCALHIPLIVDKVRSYWPTLEEEVKVWQFIRHVCASPIPKIGQNFLYDIQFLLWKMHIPVNHFLHDTMLEHHSMFPGMEKSLGFMGSIYCDEPQWKTLRRHSNKDDE